jgi:hypothetical protein
MKKILPKDRIRSEKGAGKQAKRWRNAGHERVPTEELTKSRSSPKRATVRTRKGISKAAGTPP